MMPARGSGRRTRPGADNRSPRASAQAGRAWSLGRSAPPTIGPCFGTLSGDPAVLGLLPTPLLRSSLLRPIGFDGSTKVPRPHCLIFVFAPPLTETMHNSGYVGTL